MAQTTNAFFRRFGELVWEVPLAAWLIALLAELGSGAFSVANWSGSGAFNPFILPVLSLSVLISWIAIYVGCWKIIGKRLSLGSGIIFVLSGVLKASLLLLALYFLFKGEDDASGVFIAAVMILFFAGVIAATLLAAWPIALAASSRLVSPLRIIDATRGHRWALFCSGAMLGTLGRASFIPDISEARHIASAVVIAIGNGLIGLLWTAFSVAITVTAWEFLNRLRPSSASDRDLPAT